MPRLQLQKIFSNAKLVITALVLLGGISMVLLKDTQQTAAFLSTSLKNIGMGVGTDTWEPPQQPQILGLTTGEETAELAACDAITSEAAVTLNWQQPTADTAVIEKYFVGTLDNPYFIELNGTTFSAEVSLEEGSTEFQVLAVDDRGDESLASATCVVTKDSIDPQIALISPTADVISDSVAIAATVEDVNLETVAIVVTNDQAEVVAQSETTELEWDVSSLESGEYLIALVATDKVGHAATLEKSISLDVEKPVASLAMNVPQAENGVIQNGGFETGIADWTTQGSFQISGLNGVAAQPNQGVLSAVLGSANQANQVSLASTDLNNTAEPVDSVGFWYYLDPTQAVSTTEGMMVFIGDELIFEDWLTQEQPAWKYVQADVSQAADKSITVAYYHDADQTTGGQLYLDGFVANQAFSLEDISFELAISDNRDQATAFARYTVDGQETIISTQNQTSFRLAQLPDDAVISYWAVDQAGNVADQRELAIPTLSQAEASEEPEPETEAEDQATDSAELEVELAAELVDTGDYGFELVITNLEHNSQGEYTIVYAHGDDPQAAAIQEAVQGTFQTAADESSITISDLYFGTCSAAGQQCAPHQNVQDITVIITVTDESGQTIEHQFEYTGVWVTSITEVAEESADEAN